MKNFIMRQAAKKLKARVEAITQQESAKMLINREEMISEGQDGKKHSQATTSEITEMIDTIEGMAGATFKSLAFKTSKEGFTFALMYEKDGKSETMRENIKLENLK